MPNKMILLKELRDLTQAGIKDCKDALDEANYDLQKAIDIVKVKGLNVVSGREGKVASEGAVSSFEALLASTKYTSLVEVNCQTDFVSRGPEFQNFVRLVAEKVTFDTHNQIPFNVMSLEEERKALVSSTKENVVIRRWWVEQTDNTNVVTFTYIHSNNQIGVLLTLMASSADLVNDHSFNELGKDLAMQVAAMNPLAVSVDRLDLDDVARQKSIFVTQLTELKKPQAAWEKILEGKLNKWHSEVCLLNQESVIVPKSTVQQVIQNVESKLNGTIQVVSFVRCKVGEGLESVKTDLADEVSKMVN